MFDPLLNDKWQYEDPHPDDQGILLSNRIHELCEQKLLISDDYEEKNLRPAAYTLRVGPDYIDSGGKFRHFTDEEDSFIFEKNSIVYVSIKERLHLPYHIIARFNLRVNWVYDGILLGTGPQVDPGFTGFLSCPLYNLTDADVTIKRDQDFATIDFEKTTSFLKGFPLEKKKEFVNASQDKQLQRVGKEIYSFYRAPELKPLKHHKLQKLVSSLIEMREEVRKWRQLGIGSLIAFFGLTLSLLAYGANLYRQNSELSRQLVEERNELRQATERISTLERDAEQLPRHKEQILPATSVANPGEHKENPK